MIRCTGGVNTGSARSTRAPASQAPTTSVTQWVSTTTVPRPTTAAAPPATTQDTRRTAAGISIATTPNITKAFEAWPEGKMLPPANTACAWSVTLGPSRPVVYFTAATLRFRVSSATANMVSGCQLRCCHARHAT
jgi:hypothetical protein